MDLSAGISTLLHIDSNAGWRLARSTSGIFFLEPLSFWDAHATRAHIRQIAETIFDDNGCARIATLPRSSAVTAARFLLLEIYLYEILIGPNGYVGQNAPVFAIQWQPI